MRTDNNDLGHDVSMQWLDRQAEMAHLERLATLIDAKAVVQTLRTPVT